MILVEHRDLRPEVLGRVLHQLKWARVRLD